MKSMQSEIFSDAGQSPQWLLFFIANLSIADII
jgi:hypothetical protein